MISILQIPQLSFIAVSVKLFCPFCSFTATRILPIYILRLVFATLLWSQLSEPVPIILAGAETEKLTYSAASGTARPFSSTHSQVNSAISLPFAVKSLSRVSLNATGFRLSRAYRSIPLCRRYNPLLQAFREYISHSIRRDRTFQSAVYRAILRLRKVPTPRSSYKR